MAATPKSSCSKTFSACSAAEAAAMQGATIRPRSRRSARPRFQCLDLGAGRTPEWLEAEDLISLGSSRTPPNITESHSEEGACTLSSILQDPETVPPKYFLSPKACAGILRRAALRGKALPPLLKEALEAGASQAQAQ